MPSKNSLVVAVRGCSSLSSLGDRRQLVDPELPATNHSSYHEKPPAQHASSFVLLRFGFLLFGVWRQECTTLLVALDTDSRPHGM